VADEHPARHDGLFALLLAAVSLVVYVLTLYPGVTQMGDSPKFQYLGRLLGTAHDPGYPLYIVVSWAFSYLPVGDVAYRANLLSGVCASAAAALAFLAMRRLGCLRPVAGAAALGFAFGRTFWSQAVRAEVYALAALLLAWFLFAVFRWEATRRWRDLLLAIGVAALALGDHLTIVLIAPAAVVFAVLVDRRQALRARTLVAGAVLVAAGLAQYVYILVRTHQHAKYLEAHATTFAELVRVVRGAQFEQSFFAFGLGDVVRERLPLVGGLLLQELGWAGLALAVAGLLFLVRRRRNQAAFFLVALAGVFVFALTYDVPDTEVFLIPAFVLAWPIAALGLQSLWPPRGRRRIAAAALAWLLLPGVNLAANWRANDGHRQRFEERFMTTVLRQLPARVAIPKDANFITWILAYELDVAHAAGRRDVRVVPRDIQEIQRRAAAGYEVFAFDVARNELQEQGARFERARLGVRPDAPVELDAWPVYRLVELTRCVGVDDRSWSDLAPLARQAGGRLLVRMDGEGAEATILLVGDGAAPLNPRLARPRGVTAAVAGAEIRLLRYGPAAVGQWAPESARPSVLVDLGGSPPVARARLRNPGQSATVCPDPLSGRELLGNSERVEVRANGEDEAFFGAGWASRDPGRVERTTTGRVAVLGIPLACAARVRVTVVPAPFDEPGRAVRSGQVTTVALRVNGRGFPALPVRADSQPPAWVAEADDWRAGLNDVALVLAQAQGGASATPALSIRAIRFELLR
jgi:hypothetical protein